MSTAHPKTDLMSSSAGPPTPPTSLGEGTPADDYADIDTVIYSFLEAFPQPTDEQVHYLGSLLGLTTEQFEERIFKLLGEDLQDDIEDIEDIDTVEDDPLDVFLVSYFLINSAPSETQIHELAALLGITPESLEERIYSMLADLNSLVDKLGDTTDTEEDTDIDLDLDKELSDLDDLDDSAEETPGVDFVEDAPSGDNLYDVSK